MRRNLGRSAFAAALLSAVSTAALATTITGTAPTYGCPSTEGTGTTCINGGGSSLAINAYVGTSTTLNQNGEFTQEVTSLNGTAGVSYVSAGSGAGQAAMFLNDPSQYGTGAAMNAYTVHFGASDAFVVAGSNSVPALGAGHPMATGGQFIQVPMFGTPITIPVKNKLVTANGGAKLSDADLCGIFSGLLTNWNQTSAKGLTPGKIQVYWRADNGGSGTTFLLTQHLASVCTDFTNTASSATFNGFKAVGAQSKFAKFFVGYTTPATSTALWAIPPQPGANFNAVKGSGGVADGVNNDTTGSAIGYVSPDYTAMAATPATQGSGKLPYTKLFVASLLNNGTYYAPSIANVTAALLAGGGTPPSGKPGIGGATDPAVQTNWVPAIAAPSNGYPIVGYTNLIFAQCYASATVASTIAAVLQNQINGKYTVEMNSKGFVPVTSVAGQTLSNAYGKAIVNNFVTNASGNNLNFNNPTACKGVTGR